jgi:deoxycytidylate deaminase
MSAGIVYKKSLVATGVNSYKTHPLMQSPGYHSEQIYMHAEVDAIRNALRIISQDQLTKSSIYIVRVKQENSKKYKLAMAKPCSGCERIIRSFGISHVWWSTEQIRRTHNV